MRKGIVKWAGLVWSVIDVVMPWVVFPLLTLAMVFDPGRETLNVPGTAFAVAVALASASFSYARTLPDGTATREELVFAGEQFVIGGIQFLFASIFKYASNDDQRYADMFHQALTGTEAPPGGAAEAGDRLVHVVLLVLTFLTFLTALVYAQRGVRTLNVLAIHRGKRRPRSEGFFESYWEIEKRLDAAEKPAGGNGPAGAKRADPRAAGLEKGQER